METLPDRRAPGLPDVPYSAYCRVCWQSVYGMWVDKCDHRGECPFGAKAISDCAQASGWERVKGQIKKYLAKTATQPKD